MTFYSANSKGISDLKPEQLRSIIPDNRQPAGYLSREELALALTNEGCVGIRVYKAGSEARQFTTTELIVCGVLENGFDAPKKNVGFLTDKEDTVFQLISEIPIVRDVDTLTPEDAVIVSRSSVEDHLSEDTPLLAYFSLTMLNRLLADAGVVGILLYEANLTTIQALVPHLSVPADQTLSSYVAFAAENAGKGRVLLPDFDRSELFVLSDRPCPGHCLHIDPRGAVSVGEMVVIQGRLEENPYPVPWDNDDSHDDDLA
ncbi:MAG: hypothetical protein AB8H12_03115 [Lewinella sp.]